jgi:predicted lipoprotein with Yx(FWY)xxD motif
MHKTLRLASLGLGLVAILAACSSPGAASPSAVAPSVAPSVAAPSVEPSVEPSAAESAPPVSAATGTVVVAESSLGQILTDAEGRTLYLFTPDEAGTPTCYDSCAENWPPLTATGEVTAGAGLDATKLTTVDRTDGTKQVKYGDWPLYYFAADSAAGDTNGQGVGEKWFVVAPSGDAIGG